LKTYYVLAKTCYVRYFSPKIDSVRQPLFLAAAVALSRHGATKWAELKCAVTTSHF